MCREAARTDADLVDRYLDRQAFLRQGTLPAILFCKASCCVKHQIGNVNLQQDDRYPEQ